MFKRSFKTMFLALTAINLPAMEYQPEKMDIETKNIESLPDEILFAILKDEITAGALSEFHEKYIQLQQINKNFKRILTDKQRSNLAQDLENLVKQSVNIISEGRKSYENSFDYGNKPDLSIYYQKVTVLNIIKKKYSELMKHLICKIPTIIKKDNTGCSMLYKVVQRNSIDMAKFLIDHGANVNDKNDYFGLLETALHVAAEHNFIDMAKLLIDNGADLTITNNRKKTALDMAKQKGHKDMIELLTSSSNKKRKLME